MSTPDEEIEHLQAERLQLHATIRTVLDFPKKLEYECMVPISKIGFMPGKIVHTNEFFLTTDSQGSYIKACSSKASTDSFDTQSGGKWHSYSEAAEVLMNRVADIDRKLGTLKISSIKLRTLPTTSSSHQVSKELKVVGERIFPGSGTATAKKLGVLSNEKHTEEEDIDVDENYHQQNGIEGVFEIREFIDGDGKEIKNEVVDLHAEMKEMEKKIGSLAATDDKGSAAPTLSSDQEKILNSSSFLSQLSSDIKEKTQKNSDSQDIGFEYAEQHGSEIEVLDRLDDLEREEEEWLAESEAADRIRQREKELQAKSLPEASLGGWKKGFFAKSAPQSGKPEFSNAVLMPSSGTAVSKIPSTGGESKGKLNISQPRNILEKRSPTILDPKTNTNKKSVSFPQNPSPVKENIIAAKPAFVSKAFSGSVMERFP